jgi:hypothetical protein
MANQPEQPIFDSGVYQLETADPVLGGSGGLSNIPLLNLANRTRWLKQEVDAINTTLPTKAPLNSPALTGTPTAPTQSLENATTRIASTAFARGIVSGKMEKVLSGTSGVTLTDAEAGNGLLLFSGAITAAVNIVVPDASRRWIVRNATSGGFPVTVKTATAAGVAVPSGMALELWCDGAVVRTVAANAWATQRKIALNGPVTGEVALDGSADVAIQTTVLAATDAQSGLVELATGAETVAGTDAARAVTPAGLATLTATTSRRGLVELATDAEVDAGTDAERAVTPAGVKRRIDTRATTTRTIIAGNGLTGGGDLAADRTLTLGTPGTLSGSTPNAVTAESHTHAILVATDAVTGVVELATSAETIAGTDAARAVTPAGLASLTATTSRRGLVELATDAEVDAGTDAERAVTPAALKTALLAAFPVGAVYITAGNTNPGSFLGGTWSQIAQGRTLMGVGTLGSDTYAEGETGGAARVTLTTAEMPSHNHGGATGGQSQNHTHSGTTASSGAHAHSTQLGDAITSGEQSTYSAGGGLLGLSATTGSAGAHTHTFTTDAESASHTHSITSQGSSAAHENRPPYLAVFFWQRTA